MVTIKEVAQEAGVSLGTVSNVLNGISSVSETNKAKVLNAIEKLGYEPIRNSRGSKSRESKNIGFIIPDVNNPFYPEMVRGAEDIASNLDYTLLLCNGDRRIDKERKYIKGLIERGVDGIVLVKPLFEKKELKEIAKKTSLVLVDTNCYEDVNCDVVNVSDYKGATKALNYLKDNNHEKIAFIGGTMNAKSDFERYEAYKDFMNENFGLNDAYVKLGIYEWHSGYKSMNELMRLIDPPTAVFASNDILAIGAMKAAHDNRRSIPEQISIIGYDDISMAELCNPPLTTVRRANYRIGAVGAQLLIERIQNDNRNEGTCKVLGTELVVRDTVIRRS